MLSVANVQHQVVRLTRSCGALCAVALLVVCSLPIPVYATGTNVTVEVRDSQPTSLTITTDIDGKTIAQPSVTIEGVVHNVTQIVVYVDGTYNTSIPLAAGAATYTVAFGVTPGTHEVRLAGIDAYTNSEVDQTVSFTYTPTSSGGQSTDNTDSTSSPVNEYINQTIDVAKATGQEASQQVQQASSSGVLGGLSDIAFGAFKSIDLVSSTDGTGINKMAGRFTLVTAGLAASVFPWSTYALIQKIKFIPKLALSQGAITTSMRFVGIALVAIPFLFIH